ncbi:Tkl protein kinase, partial [Globisporangium splendens]
MRVVAPLQNASTADAVDAAEWMMISISTNSTPVEDRNTDEAINKIVATKHLTIEGELGANGMPKRTLALSEDTLAAFGNLTVFDLSGDGLMVLDGVLSSDVFARSTQPLTLLLEQNLLIEIPRSIFEMTNLRALHVQHNFIRKQRLSPAQFAFLSNLSTFEVDSDAFEQTGCDNVITFKSNPSISICDPSPSSTPAQDSETAQSSSSWIVWVGGAGAFLIVVTIVGIAIRRNGKLKQLLHWQRRHCHSHEVTISRDRVLQESDAECYRAFHDRFSNTSSSLSINEQQLESWRRDPRLIKFQKPIGSKAQKSQMWLGSYLNEDVVVKTLPETASESDRSVFILDMKATARFAHPNLIQFRGIAWSKEVGMQAMVEYMDRGDLRAFLALSRGRNEPHAWWGTRHLEIALDIAQALLYLHTMQRASHCALTSCHVLLNHEYSAKLSNFTCLQYLSEYGVAPSPGSKSSVRSRPDCARWSAPEVLSHSAVATFEAVDIYSLGIILSELDTLEYPFERVQKEAKLSEIKLCDQLGQGKLTPSISSTCPPAIQELLLACIAKNPQDRPSAATIVQTLREVAVEIDRESSITNRFFSDDGAASLN